MSNAEAVEGLRVSVKKDIYSDSLIIRYLGTSKFYTVKKGGTTYNSVVFPNYDRTRAFICMW